MKTIRLKQLVIQDFKGIKELNIDFSKTTNIYGENALGKTTIFDAFTWLLFDKDSKNRSTFDIKPLDSNNQVIRGLNPTVTGVLNIDGTELKLTKIYQEKWVKKTGEAEKTFNGNSTTYEINDVPVKKSEYNSRIAEIADEKQFKLLTNPYFFNSDAINWKEAREIVLEVAGDVTTDKVINSNKDLEPLKASLEKDTIDNILKSKKASIKKLADRKKEIPTRINELEKSFDNTDFTITEQEIENKKKELDLIEDKLLNGSKSNEEKLKKQELVFNSKSKIQKIEQQGATRASQGKQELLTKLHEVEFEIKNIEISIRNLEGDKRHLELKIKALESERKTLLDQFYKERDREINLSCINEECPTCKRPFATEDIESEKLKMTHNFNENKVKIIENIQTNGKQLKHKLEEVEAETQAVDNKINDQLLVVQEKNTLIAELKKKLEKYVILVHYTHEEAQEIRGLMEEVELLEKELESNNDNNLEEFKASKKELAEEIERLNKVLAKRDFNKELQVRLNDLLEEEKKTGIEIANQEKIMALCEEFIRTRVHLLEGNINNKFKNVTFKMFKEFVNSGIEETCQALINGVPFNNANTASQINAGLDIINTLGDHFEVKMPIFIDNRESVNYLIDTENQVVNLIVSKDKELKIEGVN
jgi:exonuclease SbcC